MKMNYFCSRKADAETARKALEKVGKKVTVTKALNGYIVAVKE